MQHRSLVILCAALLVPVGVAARTLKNGPIETVAHHLQRTDGLELIRSHAEASPGPMAHVAITPTQIVVDGKPLIPLQTGPSGATIAANQTKGFLLPKLYEELSAIAEYRMAIGRRLDGLLIGDPFLFNGKLALTIDRRVPFSTVRSVMYTAGQAQFSEFHFIVDNPYLSSLTAIESRLPGFGLPWIDPADEARCRPLNLTVFVTPHGLNIAGDVPPGTPTSLPCAAGTCGGVDAYPWDAFNNTLAALKDHSPHSRKVTVVPNSAVSIEVLAKAIDYARWAPMVPLDSSEATWHEWQRTRTPMFDTPVFTGGSP